MLWLNHPKPAGNGNPVEVLLQRERRRHEGMVQRGASGGGGEVVPESLQFSVRYTLVEYTGFMWQHCGYLIRRRRIGALPAWWLCTKSTATAALHFVLQGRARRSYDFTIDAHGIVRTSGTGVTLVPWRDVSAIRRYPRGFMMVLARGTLPIPYRSLDRGGIAAMDGFATLVRAARGHGAAR